MGITKKMLSTKLSRELFLTGIIVGYSAIAGVVVGIPIVGYFLTPLIKQSPRLWRDVGPVSKFSIGTTVEVKYSDPSALPWSGTTSKAGAWLRRNSANSFTAYSMYCTHLGCPVHWIQSADLFLCPCHGSAFYGDGKVAAGPAELPLVHLPVRVRNNRVEIQTKPIPVIG
ncbi:MAG TPA: Rieske (2Fe-2S) protein [Chloroflexota bacterium]|nr:Rieske (2Fe-2S) protein [Chloroflexota bacterium]